MAKFWFKIIRRHRRIRRKQSRTSRIKYLEHKDQARELVLRKLEYFNKIYGYQYHKVAIRNQKSRWGSCSKRGNLNFNYKITLIPEHLGNYIIVHELCHLGEFNHSPAFWALVARGYPDYKKARAELKKIHTTIL